MNPIKAHKLLTVSIVAVFMLFIFLRDIFGINIPSIVFSLVWILGLLIWNDKESAAYTTAAAVCFASSLSITIPIFVFVILYLYRNKRICASGVLFCSLGIIVLELSKFMQFQMQNFKLYVNYCMIILLVSTIVSEQIKRSIFDSILFLKSYVFAFFFLSTDILLLTMRRYGSFSAIIRLSFRIGQTGGFSEETSSTMSMNANGIGLLAILATSIIILLVHYNHMKKTIAVMLGIYFSVIGFLTISKTFFLMYAIMMAMYILDNSIINAKKPINTISIFVFAGVILYIFTKTQLYTNIMMRFETGDISTGRFDVTSEYLSFMSDHLIYRLFGVGLQNVNYKSGIVHVPHNAILEIYVCLGYVGLILYFVFFASLLMNSWKQFYNVNHRRIPFINYVPAITYFLFIQGLQFLRISYIYLSIVIIVMCLFASNSVLEKQRGVNS